MGSLELQEGRPCSLQAFGPEVREVTLASIAGAANELGNWQGPDLEPPIGLTDPASGEPQRWRRRSWPEATTEAPPDAASQALAAMSDGLARELDLRDRARRFDAVVVAPSILATFGSGTGGFPANPPPSFGAATLTTAPPLKLAVTSPQWVGPIWIDCDRTIVLPSTRACVRAFAPAQWVDASMFRPGEGPTFEDAWSVWLTLKICVAPCCPTGLPIFTEILDVALDTTRALVRPRGARRVWFSSQSTPQVWSLLLGTAPVGQVIVPANTLQSVDLAAGITGIQLEPLPIARAVVVAWEVQP